MTTNQDKKVSVYSTPSCQYCVMVKDFLKKKGVEFEDINVQENQEKAQEMVQRTGQKGVPVTIIENNVVIGFDQDRIEMFLNEEKKENSAAENSIKVYSTPTCGYCVKVKDFLKENNVDFEDIDVSANQEAGMYVVNKTGQMGVPVIEAKGEFIIGFDEERLKKVLSL